MLLSNRGKGGKGNKRKGGYKVDVLYGNFNPDGNASDTLGTLDDCDNAGGAEDNIPGTPLNIDIPGDECDPDVQGDAADGGSSGGTGDESNGTEGPSIGSGGTKGTSIGPVGTEGPSIGPGGSEGPSIGLGDIVGPSIGPGDKGPKLPDRHPDTANGDWNGDATGEETEGTAGDSTSSGTKGTAGGNGGTTEEDTGGNGTDGKGTAGNSTIAGTEGAADGTGGTTEEETAGDGTNGGSTIGDATGGTTGNGTNEPGNGTTDGESEHTTDGETTKGVVFGDGTTDTLKPSAGNDPSIRLAQCGIVVEDTDDRTITYFYTATTEAGYGLDTLIDEILPQLEFEILKALAASNRVMACSNGKLLQTVPGNEQSHVASVLRLKSDPPDQPTNPKEAESKLLGTCSASNNFFYLHVCLNVDNRELCRTRRL